MKKTKPELRVEIAKDVLKHIRANKLIAESGTYFEVDTKAKYKGKQLQEVLPKVSCRVCALGGLFYGYVNKHNNFKVHTLGIRYTDFYEYKMRELMDMFSNEQLYLIECAFEQSDIGGHCRKSTDYKRSTISKAKDYREKHGLDYDETICDITEERKYDAMTTKQDGKALSHIMKNIIKNKGIFKP